MGAGSGRPQPGRGTSLVRQHKMSRPGPDDESSDSDYDSDTLADAKPTWTSRKKRRLGKTAQKMSEPPGTEDELSDSGNDSDAATKPTGRKKRRLAATAALTAARRKELGTLRIRAAQAACRARRIWPGGNAWELRDRLLRFDTGQPLEDDELEEELTVDKILGRRGPADGREYRVKWLGYPESQATWEPAANCSGCRALIAAIEAEAGTEFVDPRG
eukprot:SAG22_NODE_7204_length_762_cov_1.162896_1_plen_216_part_10